MADCGAGSLTMKHIITLLILAATCCTASGQTNAYSEREEWERIEKCIEETAPGYFERARQEYKPHVCPPVVTNLEGLAYTLVEIASNIKEVEVRTWKLNRPIEKQIDTMLRWAIDEAVDEMLEWMKTTDGAAYLSDTNEYGQWARSLGISREVRKKIAADKRSWVTSINWPIVTQTCQRTHCDTTWPGTYSTSSIVTNFVDVEAP